MSESSVAEQSHHIVTAQSHSVQSQHSHIEVSHRSAVSQRCHRSVTQNPYMVREHDRPPPRDFTWNPVSPCQVQVPGVPEIPGIIQAIYLESQAHSRWTPGLIWLGFPAKSPPL